LKFDKPFAAYLARATAATNKNNESSSLYQPARGQLTPTMPRGRNGAKVSSRNHSNGSKSLKKPLKPLACFTSSLHLIDLAGSQCMPKPVSWAVRGGGACLQEGTAINQSS
jgi:hypothetical protein